MVGLVTKYAGGVVKGFALIAGSQRSTTCINTTVWFVYCRILLYANPMQFLSELLLLLVLV